MFAYGVMLAEGQGVVKDREAAGQMFEAAAARKHPLANYNLALLFLKGDGKPENPLSRLRAHAVCGRGRRGGRAIRSGHALRAPAPASTPTPSRPPSGSARPRPPATPEAQLDYAVILFQGRGVPPDQKRGAELFRAAAEKGSAGGAEPAGALLRRTAPAWRRTWSRRPSGT